MRYINEIGAPAPADDLDALTSAADPRELSALIDVEERLGATDPYRQLGQFAHLILRKTQPAMAGD